ncbi:hypothetical protein NQ317_013656 [Molorchus minor]|uniref:REM-1 domain-containing protein n=1 Tax=Molorchus minor TaxID=1323400 RepID=A0ABQ9IX04_9CUCU|nr:hypothetical protein NQ317_013656 [Molorchus minor]
MYKLTPYNSDHTLSPFQGSDPRVATCRGKLQNRRSKLNQEINKELRLRAGAENLYKATTSRKLKETVAVELSFVNSNLQLLKEQLVELNSSVELYQGDRIPIAFGFCLLNSTKLLLEDNSDIFGHLEILGYAVGQGKIFRGLKQDTLFFSVCYTSTDGSRVPDRLSGAGLYLEGKDVEQSFAPGS